MCVAGGRIFLNNVQLLKSTQQGQLTDYKKYIAAELLNLF
jgi:hypothetical protein